MSAKFIFLFVRRTAKIFIFSFSFLIILCNSAYAVLINFDELDQNNYVDSNGDLTYLSNEYESQGLLLNYAYLVEWYEGIPAVSLKNYIAGPGFGLQFVGDELPTTVSFYLGSHSRTAVFIDVQGPYYSKQVTSSGEIHGMTDNYGTPYVSNQLFSFSARTGISSISFSGQGDAYIDDLSYIYASHTSVPEPSAIFLFFVGLLGLLARRFKIIKS